MFEMKEYVSIFQRNGVKEAEHYRMDNAPKKIYKFIPFFDNGNSKVNKRNIETLEEKRVWASKYFSLNDPFEFNGMYLDRYQRQGMMLIHFMNIGNILRIVLLQ